MKTKPATKIYKTVFHLVVFSLEPIPPGTDAVDIIGSITEGENIGAFRTVAEDVITSAQEQHEELLAIGNDGFFFSAFEEERTKGDDDGQEYGDPRDYRDGKE